MSSAPLPKAHTLHDVAQLAGVSFMTVSRALNTPQRVSPATLEKVRQAVAASGYIPNALAGGLKSKRSMTVVGLVPIISVPQFLPTVRALTDVLDAHGYQLILGQTGYDHSREEKLMATMMARRPDGIVVIGQVVSAAARQQLRTVGVPVVETWDLPPAPVDMAVGFSHTQAGHAVADHFLTRGFTRLAVATGDDARAQSRLAGFLARVGHPVPTVVNAAPSSLAHGRNALAQLLAQDPTVQAVCCSSDALAHGVMVEATARGLRVPQDLAVCGFGDADFAAHLFPSLTTVRVDGADMGRRAAQLVLDRCSGTPIAHKVVDVGFEVVARQSTGIK
jgi:LacI family transcriptional regulator, gluconate utilization system Gnt-I transcriptional repressor